MFTDSLRYILRCVGETEFGWGVWRNSSRAKELFMWSQKVSVVHHKELQYGTNNSESLM